MHLCSRTINKCSLFLPQCNPHIPKFPGSHPCCCSPLVRGSHLPECPLSEPEPRPAREQPKHRGCYYGYCDGYSSQQQPWRQVERIVIQIYHTYVSPDYLFFQLCKYCAPPAAAATAAAVTSPFSPVLCSLVKLRNCVVSVRVCRAGLHEGQHEEDERLRGGGGGEETP